MATPNLGIVHIAAAQNQKEVTANTAFDDLDLALTNVIVEAMPDVHFILPVADALTNMVFRFVGPTTANRGVTLPSSRKLYVIQNQTTSSPSTSLIFGTASSPSGRVATVSQSSTVYVILYCDGVNVDVIATSGTTLTFKTNSLLNSSQVLLNLIAGTGIVLTDLGNGSISIGTPNTTPAMVKISEVITASQGTVTFSSIPQTYRDLKVVIRGAGTKAATFTEIDATVNGDSGANYDNESVLFNNATNNTAGNAGVSHLFLGWLPASTAPANAGGHCEFWLFDYARTTFQKSFQSRSFLKTTNTAAGMFEALVGNAWRNTAAITSISITVDANNFVDGTSVTLYGIN